MAKKEQIISDEEIALALLESRTRREAAEKLDMPQRTLYERMQSFHVQSILAVMRADQLRNRLAALDAAQQKAIEVITAIMDDEKANTSDRLKAALTVLDAGRAARQELDAAESNAVGRLRNARECERRRDAENRATAARERGEMVLDLEFTPFNA